MNQDAEKIAVILPGLLVRTEAGVILDARSSVTLIRSEGRNILVDTSLAENRPMLLQALQSQNLVPENIKVIVNTHCHRDHVGNNELFPQAQIYAHQACVQKRKFIKINSFPYSLTREIEIWETLGHSWDSITVLVKLDKVYAITGDAIPLKGNYENWIPPVIHVDAERAIDSMERIVKIADIIIPGHDSPFPVKKK
jgi:glyoxylase-like metal-dependent hydrolase (beta-lactamase superfamily II)